ncbi:DNA recombination protein RmuC [Agromyces seonyuensis]|uniref:DNA recombination protein RmuC n=1 Tax=Agromyces seonyuensis TaxID=2662446 RepID=A0A6I4NVL2_9MICO|nr:DNA recombination protein RmuC [Agromyces seonyuensis]MWB98360.1 DNA recombination protein RmuC [Agromyces seonyuensis]
MEIVLLIIGLVVGALLGFVVARLVGRGGASAAESAEVAAARHERTLLEARAAADADRASLLAAERAVQSELTAQLAAADAAADGLREQLGALQSQQREAAQQQRLDQAERQAREQRESQVLQALSPVRETLAQMQSKVAEIEQQRANQYGSLAEQLKQAQIADERLRTTTESLASALRSNGTRGVWGETQLRRVVEAAGLIKHVDFDEQLQITTDAGRGRPDMVINLPGGKYIPLDSKVPLEHYLEASAIPETAVGEEGARRKALLGQHVKAMRGHIDALAKKGYWNGLDSPEFVIAFVPSESLLSAALEADPVLLTHAFERRVALASPVNLFAVLKTIDYAWQQQAVSDEAKKLFDLGTLLYSRIGTLVGHADGLRKAIERTVDSYNKFASSLESRVLVTARQFPGIDESKLDTVAAPPHVHDQPRRLTAGEFDAPVLDAGAAADAAESVRLADAGFPAGLGGAAFDDPPFDDAGFDGTGLDGADLDPEIRNL